MEEGLARALVEMSIWVLQPVIHMHRVLAASTQMADTVELHHQARAEECAALEGLLHLHHKKRE
jgi:hypothetical protein